MTIKPPLANVPDDVLMKDVERWRKLSQAAVWVGVISAIVVLNWFPHLSALSTVLLALAGAGVSGLVSASSTYRQQSAVLREIILSSGSDTALRRLLTLVEGNTSERQRLMRAVQQEAAQRAEQDRASTGSR